MGFLDKLKVKAKEVKEKAVETVDEKSPQIKGGINKAGQFVDKKTKGKYSDKIAKGTHQAAAAVDKIKAEDSDPGATMPPTTAPPSTNDPTPPPPPPPAPTP